LLAAVSQMASQMASQTANGKVGLSALGKYLKEHHPDFTPPKYGHSNLLKMLKNSNELKLHQDKAE